METISLKNRPLKNKLLKSGIVLLVIIVSIAMYATKLSLVQLGQKVINTSSETKVLLSIILFITFIPLILAFLPAKTLKNKSGMPQRKRLLESRRKRNKRNIERLYKKST